MHPIEKGQLRHPLIYRPFAADYLTVPVDHRERSPAGLSMISGHGFWQ
jgi:hypothetical protein